MGLFGGKSDSATPAPAAAPSPFRDGRDSSPTSGASAGAATVIAKDAFIKGEIRSSAEMLVEGKVEGEIHGSRVIIGENGEVQARIVAEVLIVRGTVRGDCEGSTKVEITSTGKVFGNIASRAIVVAEGATFRGASRMAIPDEPRREARPLEAAPSAGSGVSPQASPTTAS